MKINKKFLIEHFVWGSVVWFFGYVLGILFFAFVPSNVIGWIIMPFGILFTIYILNKKIALQKMSEYLTLGVVWAILAVVLDYFLLVKVFNPADGYYKLDVYLYYTLTLLIPIIYGYIKRK